MATNNMANVSHIRGDTDREREREGKRKREKGEMTVQSLRQKTGHACLAHF